MKVLVVYYSFEGNTRFIAETIAHEIGAEFLVLKPKKEIQTHGFMKYFWGGKQATMKETPELLPLKKNPSDYDFIFIGTPVWAFTFAPPLRSFFSTQKLKGKKVALFCCHGGNMGKTLEQMKEQVMGNTVVGEIDFREPLKNDKEGAMRTAQQWATEIIQTMKDT
jgi:flavodoxin